MSVDILGTNCDQCVCMVQCCFTSTETIRLIRTGSPGRPPRLSHSSRTLRRLGEHLTHNKYPHSTRICNPISSSPPPDLSLQPDPQIPVTCCSNCWALPHYHHYHSYEEKEEEEEAYRDECKELKREASLQIKYAVSGVFPDR